MARVKLRVGQRPNIIVAPHGGGPTDIRSAEMAEIIAQATNSFAVINTGWIRPWKGHKEGSPKTVINTKEDIKKGFANLNDLRQAGQKPAQQEFLQPIEDYKNFILQFFKIANIFLIHGMDDTIRDYNGVDVVVGYGAGDPPRYSCPFTFKDRFIGSLAMEGFKPAQGKSGGRLSAWDKHNLNQLYSNHARINSVQVEIGLTIRDTDSTAAKTAIRVASAINNATGNIYIPFMKKIPER